MSVVCPNCHHQEPEGALFCPECGSKMIIDDGLSTTRIISDEINKEMASKSSTSTSAFQAEAPDIETFISLHIVQTGQILPLVGREEFTIGRVSDGQSILPDIDLTPYEAYAQGVSRLHATIQIKDDTVVVTDLGSANGTRVNKEKITSHVGHLLNHGDIINLGQLRIQTLIRKDKIVS
ncbi:MAG: FHA domain-containing protein [Chloroflexi bacterium]|jgi:pSer/pThr/pTyr-binding forkhead associated (FHA) protein|nr:FHA domain-containing protein [Chloroflexota bacterium]MBT3670698.1 FHA domain-containing protein [Chloroflexota bacterium]MBT4002643.1 FHA domain-containing protein [Chloroflexota bacterium]MBT4306266.1 FHA domain-containing protein [Chloroflexota bacterium]MBT4532853.1 FHA domain-containing protein [Chloroflexota bacterium]